RVQRQPIDQRPLLLAAGRAIVTLEPTEKDPLAASVKRIDRERQSRVPEMHADLVRLAGFGKAAEQCEAAERLLEPPLRPRRSAGVFYHRHALGRCRMR